MTSTTFELLEEFDSPGSRLEGDTSIICHDQGDAVVIQRGGDLVHIQYQFQTAAADQHVQHVQHAQKALWEGTVDHPTCQVGSILPISLSLSPFHKFGVHKFHMFPLHWYLMYSYSTAH